MSKPKVAFYWCASCGGCEEAVVDLNERILDVTAAVDICFWPVALDFKYDDLARTADGEIAVSFINGSVRNGEQEEIVKTLRAKSGLVVAFGSCAHLGGIPGLANFCDKDSILNRAYRDVPSVANESCVFPQERTVVDGVELTLPSFFDSVKTLDQTTAVDYYLPGCPPPPDLIAGAVGAILKGELPEKGAVLAPDKTLCETCPRKESKPDEMKVKDVARIHEIEADPEKCFMDQGVICLGPATRGGCGERCIAANMPCRGCFGPPAGARDQGAKFLSALASVFDAGDEAEARRLASAVVDPAGTFYRFGLPGSLLGGKVAKR